MQYMLTDINSTANIEANWYGSYDTREQAENHAMLYPGARFVIEYRSDLKTKGLLPTGSAWELGDSTKRDKR